MDGVRGLEAISGQKLGGFRALWLPLFAPLIECHAGEVDERWMVLVVGLRHSSHSMIEKPARFDCSTASNDGLFLQGGLVI